MQDLDLRVLLDNYANSIKVIDKLYSESLDLKNELEQLKLIEQEHQRMNEKIKRRKQNTKRK